MFYIVSTLHIVFEFVVIFHADKLSKLPKYIVEPHILFTVKSHEKEPTLFSKIAFLRGCLYELF